MTSDPFTRLTGLTGAPVFVDAYTPRSIIPTNTGGANLNDGRISVTVTETPEQAHAAILATRRECERFANPALPTPPDMRIVGGRQVFETHRGHGCRKDPANDVGLYLACPIDGDQL